MTDSAGTTENRLLEVFVRSRNRIFFRGKASTVTSVNDTGDFDILAAHANFISLIKIHVTLDKGRESEQKFDIESGVLSVFSNEVNVYMGL